ncbi:uncharacterized protein LOC129574649 [Sitodiplosis mosellana]|uniref:uncharacterized protein LOC129574649 n=1 Tax=Sitodiplosis mosellana TaxID=263140 RepID=UPI002443A654|nr:uncharacterized protein LOC129574649 [Sitodiplosis mosellana]
MNYIFSINQFNFDRMVNWLIKLAVILGMLIYISNALQLEGLATKKPRTTKFPSKAAGDSGGASVSLYRVNNTKGTTCILIRTDGILDIKYRKSTGEDATANTFMPDETELSGDCSDDNVQSLTMIFKGFTLFMLFKKTPGGERWYVSTIDLAYSSSNPLLEQIDRPNLQVKLTSDPSKLLFPTPVGKSYSCNESDIILHSRDEYDGIGHTAILNLRELRMQSFMFRVQGTWGPPYQCSASGTYRDESAPLFVGTTLAIASLAAVSAYGVWRYYKIKKFQYGTME